MSTKMSISLIGVSLGIVLVLLYLSRIYNLNATHLKNRK